MTKNRTAIDLFSSFGVEFVVVVLITLAMLLAITNYLWARREALRRIDLEMDRLHSPRLGAARRRAAREQAA